MPKTNPPTYEDILAAQKRLKNQAVVTPLLSSPQVNEILGGEIFIKAEALQRTGSFKFRGACNAIGLLGEEVRSVVAWSSGNHAQAVATAATAKGITSKIVMPKDAPLTKIEGTKSLGGEVILYDRYTESREEIGLALAKKEGAEIIPPYDFVPVIAGQGTIGIEIAEMMESSPPDQVISCTGGGGLLSGVSIALHEHFPDAVIIAVEPENFDDACRSLEAGERLGNTDKSARTICDAITTPMLGEITFPIILEHVRHGVAVSDEEVLKAIAFAWAHYKIVLEPAGAVALAGVLTGKVAAQGKRTVIIASGGNVSREIFARALEYI